MTWLEPIGIGMVQGLLFFWPVVGLTLCFRIFRFPDISIEGSFLIGACVFATAARESLNVGPSLILAVAAASCIGALTAATHSVFGINKFLAGILLTAACYSLALRIADASNIGLLAYVTPFDSLRKWNSASLNTMFDFSTLVVLLLLALVTAGVLALVLSSRIGLRVRVGAVGGLPAVNLRIPHTLMLVIALTGTAALSGLGGALVAMRQGFFDVNMNQGVLIVGLASMALGEHIAVTHRLPAVLGALTSALAGSVIYQILISIAIRIGANPSDLRLITTGLVFVALVLGRKKQPEGIAIEP